MSNAYRLASTWACDSLEPFISKGDIDLPDVSFSVALLMLTKGFWFRAHQRPYLLVNEQSAAEIVRRAWESPDVHEFCCAICADQIDTDTPLVPSLRQFLLEVLVGTPTPKRGRGRPATRWLHRALMYGTALKVRDRFGLDLTRNEASPSLSASDAVAEALTVCGRLTKFEEVAALCTHADHRQFRADYAIYDYARANKINFDAAVEVLLQREKTAVAYSPDVSG